MFLILYLKGKYVNVRLLTHEVGSLFLKAAIERDMRGTNLAEKCHYHQGCISNKKELIRMGQAISYKDNNGKVKIIMNKIIINISAPYINHIF